MENTNENPHLNIETVTPDTEKDGQPNDQRHNHRVENEVANDSDEKPEADKAEGTGDKEPYAIYEKQDGETPKEPVDEKPEDEDSEDQDNEDQDSEDKDVNDQKPENQDSEDKQTENNDDSGTDIETVAP